ncbi:MAG TPA: tetratricopeptide repeat protein [Planctomycetota bacterium]
MLARVAARPALVLGLLSGGVAAIAFVDSGLVLDDTAYLHRFLPTFESLDEALYLPPAFRAWFGPLQRPLPLWSLLLDETVWGRDWRGFHLTQALLHGLGVAAFTVLAGVLLARLTALERGARRRATWVAGLLFALHPVHVETAAWISARQDALMAAFLLAGLLAVLRVPMARRERSRWWLGGAAALAGAAAALSKETGYAFFALAPAILVLDPLVRRAGPDRRRVLAAVGVPLLLALGGCLLLRLLGPGGEDMARPWHPQALRRWFAAVGWAFTQTVAPLRPCLLVEPVPSLAWGFAAAAGGLAWLVLGVRALRRGNALPCLGLLLAGVTLAPTWMVAWQELMSSIVADRYLMLPVGGVALAVSVPLAAPRATARAVLVTVLLLHGAATVRYAAIWSGPPRALALELAAAAPTSIAARAGALARALRADDVAAARHIHDLWPPAQDLPGRPGEVTSMRASLLWAEGDYRGAATAAWSAAEAHQTDPRRWQQAGVMLYDLFRETLPASPDDPTLARLLGDAQFALLRAAQGDPRAFRSWLYLGRAQASFGRMPEAMSSFAEAARRGGGTLYAEEARWRAWALDGLAGIERARAAVAAAGDGERWHRFGLVLEDYFFDSVWQAPQRRGQKQLVEAALAAFESALAVEPGRASSHYHRGLALATLGREAEAATAFETAIELDAGGRIAENARRSLRWLAD